MWQRQPFFPRQRGDFERGVIQKSGKGCFKEKDARGERKRPPCPVGKGMGQPTAKDEEERETKKGGKRDSRRRLGENICGQVHNTGRVGAS